MRIWGFVSIVSVVQLSRTRLEEEISVAVLGSSYSVESGNVGILLEKPFGAENAVSYRKLFPTKRK